MAVVVAGAVMMGVMTGMAMTRKKFKPEEIQRAIRKVGVAGDPLTYAQRGPRRGNPDDSIGMNRERRGSSTSIGRKGR